ncbi:hypothetical protein MHH28_07635 [Paenibacillus sp. FSL K6-1217]|uniref:hypothetical protein n=1 Tax=Paenibacillus sp. FSL K6-1217 TaxID=2921466 RepID=UPI0032468E81
MAVLTNKPTAGAAPKVPTSTAQAVAATNPAAQVAAPANVSPNSAYGIQTRQALNNMGVDNQRIGFQNGYVTIDGQNIFKPGVNQNGVSYVNQAMLNSQQGNINQLNNAYKLTQQVVNPQSVVNPYDSQITQQLAALNQPVAANPYDNQIADVLAQLTQRINNPTPYDPYSSPEYAAQQAAAQRGAQQSTRAAQESLGASGFGRSSNLSDRAQGIQNQANEYMQLQVIPQLISANQAQQQQGLANLSSLVSALSGQQGVYENRAQSDRSNQYNILEALMNQQGVNDTRSQNQFSNANTALNYLADQNQRGIDNTRNQRNDNLNAANLVSQLTGRVVNPQTDWQGLFRQASNSNAPLTADQQNAQFNQNLQTRQQTFNEGQQNWSNQFDQAKFDEDTRRYGLDYALQQQQINISGMNANTSRTGSDASIANSQFGQLMDVWKANGTAPSGLEGFGIKAGTPYSTGAAAKAQDAVTAESYATSYLDKSVNRDDDGNITNLNDIKAQILQSGLPDSDIAKLYSRYGIPLPAGYSGN